MHRLSFHLLEPRCPFSTLTVSDVHASESDPAATFHVTLDAPSAKPITLAYATQSLTAKSNKDFAPLAGRLILALGLPPSSTPGQNTTPSTSTTSTSTYYGDANLRGTVNADDYALLDRSSIHNSNSSWLNGDFNYDGQATSADYLLIDTSYSHLSGGALSPELLAQREQEFGDAYVARLIAGDART